MKSPGIFFRTLFFLVSILAVGVACEGAKALKHLRKVPDWVVAGSRIETTEDGGDTGCVVLRESQEIEIDEDGHARVVNRLLVKITDLEGRGCAMSILPYLNDSEKVESIRAWVINEDGSGFSYDRKDVVDRVHLSQGGIVSSQRTQVINASGDVRVGTIFASETIREERGTFLSWSWSFNGDYPCLKSTVGITVPEGWQVRSYFSNMEEVSPEREGNRYEWTKRDLDVVEYEEWAPVNSVEWLDLTVSPPAGSTIAEKFNGFDTWESLALYFTDKYRARIGEWEAFRARVRELTETEPSELGKVEKLASLARSVNYVSISLNLGRGGGRVPRAADEVWDSNYGDCKDKSNMLCHQLAAIGVAAYPLIVQSTLRYDVDENNVSANQFNHCIAAIQVGDDYDGGATIVHPTLGRLLIFDPTDEMTAFGDLHKNMQGSKGILLAGQHGGLIELPKVDPERSLLERNIEAEILPNGGIVAKLKETSVGQMSRSFRVNYRNNIKSSGFAERFKKRLSNWVSAAKISSPEVVDDLAGDSFSVEVDFAAPQFAKTMGGALIIFKPVIIEREEGLPFEVEGEREQDLILAPRNFEETAKIYIPVGFKVSEMVDEVVIMEDFGKYENRVTVEGDTLFCHRRLWVDRTRIPVDRFEEAKAFYERISEADQATVVLEKI